MKNPRISTGIGGLDEILKGGFIPGASYLILGSEGFAAASRGSFRNHA